MPDGRYAGYVSLGVVEHRREGPEPFLREAFRILADGGTAIFSVPHFHLLRRVKARLGIFSRPPGDREFYQFAYAGPELRRLLTSVGFEVVEEHHWNAVKGSCA